VGARCGEACQRKGHADAFFYQIYTAGSRGGVWESYGNTLYNTATTQGALMMEMAKGMAISNAYIKVAVNGGGSKTSTNNVLGALAAASSSSGFWSNPGAYLPSLSQGFFNIAFIENNIARFMDA